MGFEDFGASIDLLTEYRFNSIQFQAHVHILRPLTGKHKNNRPILLVRKRCKHSFGVRCIEGVHGLINILADDNTSVAKLPAADLQGISRISQVKIRLVF